MLLGKNLTEKLVVFIATWGYSGFIPPVFFKGMAGTYGSLASIPLCYLALYLTRDPGTSGIYVQFILWVYSIGISAVPLAEEVIGPRKDWHGATKVRDQNQIVIDEVLGMLITYYLMRYMKIELFSWPGTLMIVLGFLYFRLFDIKKIWPATVFDREKSAFGVMMDDVASGVQAGAALYLSYLLYLLVCMLFA